MTREDLEKLSEQTTVQNGKNLTAYQKELRGSICREIVNSNEFPGNDR